MQNIQKKTSQIAEAAKLLADYTDRKNEETMNPETYLKKFNRLGRRIDGLLEYLQRKYKITIVNPIDFIGKTDRMDRLISAKARATLKAAYKLKKVALIGDYKPRKRALKDIKETLSELIQQMYLLNELILQMQDCDDERDRFNKFMREPYKGTE